MQNTIQRLFVDASIRSTHPYDARSIIGVYNDQKLETRYEPSESRVIDFFLLNSMNRSVFDAVVLPKLIKKIGIFTLLDKNMQVSNRSSK